MSKKIRKLIKTQKKLQIKLLNKFHFQQFLKGVENVFALVEARNNCIKHKLFLKKRGLKHLNCTYYNQGFKTMSDTGILPVEQISYLFSTLVIKGLLFL